MSTARRWHFLWQLPTHWPLIAWGKWGPASRPDWWMFRWLTVGPLHVRIFRKNPPWKANGSDHEQR